MNFGTSSGKGPRLAVSAFALALAIGPSAASAAVRDRTPPTTPTNLRVVGTPTSYSVKLAWNPSTDNSGSFTYTICCAYSNLATVPQTATSFTFTAGLEAGRSFTFRISARDAAGNASGYSNAVTVRLPPDTIPPTKPVVTLTDVGPTHASLAFQSSENGPNIWFAVFKDGIAVQGVNTPSVTIPLLTPATTYAFTAMARDFGGNVSPLSDPLMVTTEPRNTADTTAPTTPANFYQQNWGCETELTWSASTDDFDPPQSIEYRIFVNDAYDHSLTLGWTRTIVYGTLDGENRFAIVAVDSAGNTSAPATVTAFLDCVP
jgi:fibronectin type III domain protein